ncbi:hypothetical protein HD554DRAFT_381049 [Boletus coccyginus]|nr:hypothetical protein HD554DRAFT_381049 [Boletus coccyginus]
MTSPSSAPVHYKSSRSLPVSPHPPSFFSPSSLVLLSVHIYIKSNHPTPTMRFTLVPVALLVLAHSVAPGVYGAPAVATNPLAARQNIVSVVTGLLSSVLGDVANVLSDGTLSTQTIQQIVEQITQQLGQALPGSVSGLVPRADAKSSTSSPSLSSTTPSVGLATTTVHNASSVSLITGTPHASSTAPTRMRRQLPIPIPSGSASSLPVPFPSVVLSKLGSVTPGSTASKPSSSASHV